MLNIKLASAALSGLLALGGFGLATGETQIADVVDSSRTALAHFRGSRGPQIPLVNPDERDTVIAEVLGITVDELREARAEGIRLPELAAELDVDMADVVDALQALLIDEVEAAVAEGDMTQERADRILERIKVANVMRDYFGWETRLEALADALGVTVEDLLEARDSGISLREMIADAGIALEEVREAVSAARDEAINQALEDGALNEAQAERLLNAHWHFFPRGLRGHFFRLSPPTGAEGALPSPSLTLNG